MGTTYSDAELKIRHSVKVLMTTAITLGIMLVLLSFACLSVQSQVRDLNSSLQSLQSQKKTLQSEMLFVNSEYYNEKIQVDVLKTDVDGATVIRFGH
ncbi:hypothetical protein [Coprothermobacter platensis]|jgi:predicted PurR-regulated permease PerM|uniref:hypothetical protein n=1 Tax=Coprothermobacter platensis TaxID=108819 RepID=UPI00036635B4|nr:hypothetical protein [Coprothermobacter platensis]